LKFKNSEHWKKFGVLVCWEGISGFKMFVGFGSSGQRQYESQKEGVCSV